MGGELLWVWWVISALVGFVALFVVIRFAVLSALTVHGERERARDASAARQAREAQLLAERREQRSST